MGCNNRNRTEWHLNVYLIIHNNIRQNTRRCSTNLSFICIWSTNVTHKFHYRWLCMCLVKDVAGLSSKQRVTFSLDLKTWLLSSYSFSHFPPPSAYVKGIPRVTFEALACSIDAHILLYDVVNGGSYNWRSLSTLVAENFMGEISERCSNSKGVPSGQNLPHDMAKVAGLYAWRLNPNR